MKVFKLSFATINIIHDCLAEVIINDGVEMNVAMVEAYHNFLLDHLTPPFSLLVNKINPYSYTFEAQVEIASLKEIDHMAVVIYNSSSKMATNILIQLNKTHDWNIELFNNREEAMDWLSSVKKV